MPECQIVRKKKRQYCVGDLRDVIKLQNRDITPPPFGDPDFSEVFTEIKTIRAAVNTVKGRVWFDGVSTDINITHIIGVRFTQAIGAQTWIEFKGRRLDILEFINIDERSIWMELICNDRGEVAKAATQASGSSN